jgi:hypothetical protein
LSCLSGGSGRRRRFAVSDPVIRRSSVFPCFLSFFLGQAHYSTAFLRMCEQIVNKGKTKAKNFLKKELKQMYGAVLFAVIRPDYS